jgi:hypothetical protein
MTAPLTDAEIEEARALNAGWRGLFRYRQVPGDEGGDDEHFVEYIPVDGGEDDAHTISDTLASGYDARALAAYLRLPPRLFATVDARDAENRELRAEVDRWRGLAQQWRAELDTVYERIDAVLPEGQPWSNVLGRIHGAGVLIASLLAEVERLTKERDEAQASATERHERELETYDRACSEATHVSLEELCAITERTDPAEASHEIFTAPAGPAVRCEVCCAPIEPGAQVASWVDEERQVVAHAERCPEPDLWWNGAPECLPRPFEDEYVDAVDLIKTGWTSAVLLVRQRKGRGDG